MTLLDDSFLSPARSAGSLNASWQHASTLNTSLHTTTINQQPYTTPITHTNNHALHIHTSPNASQPIDESEGDSFDLSSLSAELSLSVQLMQQRYMLFAMRWAAELLRDVHKQEDGNDAVDTDDADDEISNKPLSVLSCSRSVTLSLAYLELREYERAAWQLRPRYNAASQQQQTNTEAAKNTTLSSIARNAQHTFLYLYASFLAYQQRLDSAKTASHAQQTLNNNATHHTKHDIHTQHSSQSATQRQLSMELKRIQEQVHDSIAAYTTLYATALNDNADANTAPITSLRVDLSCMWYLYALVCHLMSGGINSNASTQQQAIPTNNGNDRSYIAHARYACIQSINLYACNWSCWKLLSSLCYTRQDVLQVCVNGISSTLTLPVVATTDSNESTKTCIASEQPAVVTDHWLRQFWLADVLLEVHEDESSSDDASISSLQIIDTLAASFPHSTYLLQQAAIAHYHKRDFDVAQQLFESLRDADPYRIDSLDIYSNILYVKELRAQLSYLAHWAHQHHKYTPQCCVIVGNYYSLRGQHEHAITYFRRALQLDATYLSAWTLQGHEYGLGQAYELLQLNTYALYYFKRAVALRPFDARFWCALAECYSKLRNDDAAIKCYLRAEGNDDREGLAVYRLATLFARRNDAYTAAHYYKKVLQRAVANTSQVDEADDAADNNADTGSIQQQQAPALTAAALQRAVLTNECIEAMQFLAEHARNEHEYDMCEQYCNRLMDADTSSNIKEVAKSMLIEVRQIKAAQQGDSSSRRQRMSVTTNPS